MSDWSSRPASFKNLEDLTEAFLETWPEVSRAMPWINPDRDVEGQLSDFLDEAERMGGLDCCIIG